ncbi:MAG: hypothetical protein OXJ56_16155 [Rhodospirillaceae bacterium]|nr:hypothetical protein [Rhodospirillaceae bacterium]
MRYRNVNGTTHPTVSAAAGAVCRAVVLCAGSVVLSAAIAAEYSWQVTGGYEDIDSEGSIETNHSSMRATWYFSAVDDQVGPYELAPFLNRSSHVSVSTGRTKLREQLYPAIFGDGIISGGPVPDNATDFHWLTSPGSVVTYPASWPSESGLNSSEYALDGRYVWPGAGWYAGAHASRSDADMLPDYPFAQTTAGHESAGLFAGRYFGTRTALELDFGSDTASQETLVTPFFFDPVFGGPVLPGNPGIPGIPGFEPIELRTGTDIETDEVRLSVRHVGQLGDSTVAFSASIRSSRSETRLILPEPRGFFPAIDEFGSPVRFVSDLSPDSIYNDIFESERERGYSLSGALFPTPALGVHLNYTNSDHDTWGIRDAVGLSANWFFLRNAAIEIQLVRTDSGGGYFTGSPDSDSLGVRLHGRF